MNYRGCTHQTRAEVQREEQQEHDIMVGTRICCNIRCYKIILEAKCSVKMLITYNMTCNIWVITLCNRGCHEKAININY